jgi:hypothetical protein
MFAPETLASPVPHEGPEMEAELETACTTAQIRLPEPPSGGSSPASVAEDAPAPSIRRRLLVSWQTLGEIMMLR